MLLPRVLGYVRVSGTKWLSIYLSPFIYGTLSASPGVSRGYVIFGSTAICLWSFQLTLWNRLADRRIDAVNEPNRVEILARLGERHVRRTASWCLLAILGLVLVAQVLGVCSFGVAMSWACFVVISLSYNLGPRHKVRPVLAVLAMAITIPVLYGLGTVQHSVFDFERWFECIELFAFGLSVLAMGAKDVTDVPGDRLEGFEAAFQRLLRLGRPAYFAVALSPYVLIAAVALVDQTVHSMVPLLCLPASVAGALTIANAHDMPSRVGARETALLLYLAGNCLIAGRSSPQATVAVTVAAVAVGAYIVIDERLNSDQPSFRQAHFRAAFSWIGAG